MPPPKETPRYIYKILDEAPPSPLPATLPPLSDLDQKDGFVHLSTARQVYIFCFTRPPSSNNK